MYNIAITNNENITYVKANKKKLHENITYIKANKK